MSEKEAVQILENAWEDFKKYFDEKCRRYSSEMKRDEAEKSHWICWSEFDLLMQLARFFYKRSEQKGLDNVEMHINETLRPKNFDDYTFYKSLKIVKEKLDRTPKSDLIIAFEDSLGKFILCAEAKCLRYPIEQGRKTVISELEKDKETLLALKNNNICFHIGYILLDDHYFLNEKGLAGEIEKTLDEYERNYSILKLYHTSKAKIPSF